MAIEKAIKLVTVDGQDVHRFSNFNYDLTPKNPGRTKTPANRLGQRLREKHIRLSTEKLGIQTQWIDDGTTEVIYI